MNIEDLVKMAKEQAAKVGQPTLHNQREVMTGYVAPLQKHEMKPLKTSIVAMFKEIQLPFNPLDPTDTTFSTKNLFIVEMAPSEFVWLMKAKMREDKNLHRYYASLIGKTVDTYNISQTEVNGVMVDYVSDDDFAIFNQYTYPIQLSEDTIRYSMPACGQYGMERLSPLEKNSDGELVKPETRIAGQLLLLEQAVRQEKVAEFYLNNDKDKLTSDLKDKLLTIRRSSKVGFPKKSGVLLFLEFECQTVNNEDALVPIKTKDSFDNYYRYFNCNTEELKKIMKKFNKRKYDKYLDVIFLKMTYDDGVSAKGVQTELDLYRSREYSDINFAISDEEVKSGKEQSTEDPTLLFGGEEAFFKLAIPQLTQGLSGDYEHMVKRNIYKFRPLSDELLLSYYKTRLQEIKGYITNKVFMEHFDIINTVDKDLAAKLTALDKEKKLPVSFLSIVSTDSANISDEVKADIKALDTLDSLGNDEAPVIDQELPGAEEIASLV